MIFHRTISVVLTLVCITPVEASSDTGNIVFRKDLYTFFSKKICAEKTIPKLKDLWFRGIFDAQIEGYAMGPSAGAAASRIYEDLMEESGVLIAGRSNHHGICSGVCDDGTRWLITMPSSAKVQLGVKIGEIKIPVKKHHSYCGEIEIDYASSRDSGYARVGHHNLNEDNSDISIDTESFDDGLLSITCIPKASSSFGASILYLIPIKRGPYQVFPFEAFLGKAKGTIERRIAEWVNILRKEEGLRELTLSNPLFNSISNQMIEHGSIVHDRSMMAKASEQLKRYNFEFIGENRVKGEDAAKMAWLLWHSPRHRALLLDKRSTHLAVSSKDLGNEKLAVLAFAKF
ncbi:MAG: hypothetical protein HQK54_06190 [Oligoflexales bacterium]|nr:hypothetical protein [Oligoflexales bacterium]